MKQLSKKQSPFDLTLPNLTRLSLCACMWLRRASEAVMLRSIKEKKREEEGTEEDEEKEKGEKEEEEE